MDRSGEAHRWLDYVADVGDGLPPLGCRLPSGLGVMWSLVAFLGLVAVLGGIGESSGAVGLPLGH